MFRAYNYHEIRTPMLEETQLFARGVGQETDIVTKEMYTFEDRDGTSLTLRPENTASVIRAYIEHRLDQRPGVQKLYYMGPMFRRERPQKGRYRQFYQIGAEAIGSESPVGGCGSDRDGGGDSARRRSRGFQVLVNSVGCPNCRPQYIELLREALAGVAPKMCEDCRRRADTNPLRVLDCKVGKTSRSSTALPSILDHLCEICRAAFRRGEAVSARIAAISSRSGRGWCAASDYYMRTTFEVVHGWLGAQNSVLGGGRYDGLAEVARIESPRAGYRILDRRGPAGDDCGGARRRAIARSICSSRRWAKRRCGTRRTLARDIARGRHLGGSRVDGKLKRAMELANKLGARYTLIVGDNEIASGNTR